MLALLSPAKKLDATAARTDLPATRPVFLKDAIALAAIARKLTKRQLAGLMGISDKLAALNHARFQAFAPTATADNAKHALLAFAGDTYIGLNAKTLSDDGLAYAQDHVRILSGLYGLLRPLDLIQPYRLEMGTKLATPKGEDLYDFWGDKLTAEVNKIVAKEKTPVVVNLASAEYFSALKPEKLKARLVTPVFKEEKSGVAKILGMMAKRARGMMARYIIEERITDPEALKKFAAGGYRYQPARSTGDTLVFHRKG
ncbi:MAG: peroxide stress protein YaaA [Proteobacteria bacterium]|nr:MAG: peroxide stress protein YaaA [Pseudomonadota bacterium]